jgi:hypothetical protein
MSGMRLSTCTGFQPKGEEDACRMIIRLSGKNEVRSEPCALNNVQTLRILVVFRSRNVF